MSETDGEDTDYTDGKLYTYTKTLTAGIDYTYYFEAYDINGSTATPTTELSGPVVNTPPKLAWLNDTGYVTDGINPNTGVPETSFTYKVVYTDTDNHPPKTGYPKVHIYSNGQSIQGSPFSMQFSSGTHYTTGATYSYSKLLSTGISYSYMIDCYDQLNDTYTLTGTGPDVLTYVAGYVRDPAGDPISGINVCLTGATCSTYTTTSNGYYEFFISTKPYKVSISHSYYNFSPSSVTLKNVQSVRNIDFKRASRCPSIACTNEDGYQQGPVTPGTKNPENPITFRIIYTDPDRDQVKTSYPSLNILKEGATVQTLTMKQDSGDYASGVIFTTFTYVLRVGTYTYNITAYDLFDEKSTDISGSFVVYKAPPLAPVNQSFKVLDGATVVSAKILFSWASSGENITYTLYLSDAENVQPAPSISHAPSLSSVYTGAETAYEVSNLEPGKQYYWQIKAEDQYGASSFSPLYSFKTLATIRAEKSFNYPTPFNPAIGENTNIVFNMEEAGNAEITIYSEYGDLCWKKSYHNLPQGTNEEIYDGTDGSGRMMYNGTYVCLVRKTYNSGRKQRDFCRILIIK
jgi:hypothetical protein